MSDSTEYLESMGRLLGFASRSVSALARAILAEHDLTLPQWVALTALWRADGMTVTALARYTKSTVPAASRLIGRMEEQGLVQRRSPKGDRRTVRVWLTRRSKAMSGLLEVYNEVNDKILEGFSETDRNRITVFLNRIIENAGRHYAAYQSGDPTVV